MKVSILGSTYSRGVHPRFILSKKQKRFQKSFLNTDTMVVPNNSLWRALTKWQSIQKGPYSPCTTLFRIWPIICKAWWMQSRNYTHLNGFVLAFLFPPTHGSPWSIASPAQKFSSTTKIFPSNPKATKLQIYPDTLRMIPFATGSHTDYSRTLSHIWWYPLFSV